MSKAYYLPEVKQKIERYCAYQERCQQEVRDKLFKLGCKSEMVDFILSELIQNNYVNEQRFADSFASGKLKIKGWGRIKIQQKMRLKRVSEVCIQKALAEIDDELYFQRLTEVGDAKLKLINGKLEDFNTRRKVYNFLYNRGFESEMIQRYLDK